MTLHDVSLDDKYTATSGRIFISGIQALVRLPMVQMRRDRAAGLNTGAFVSGYRGSPLGGLDQQFEKARRLLAAENIVFRPGVNEDLAATAVWGTQQLGLSPGARKDGVVGIWYGKGPGVDRSGDVFKHANAAGTARHGGVLAIAGDDHSCKSSSIPHQSDHAFMSAIMPVLYPSTVQEFVEYGLLGIAMSRFAGVWVGMKVIADTVETTASVDLAGEARRFVIPEDVELPPSGLNFRWPDRPMEQDDRLQSHKGYAAIAFARANRVDAVTHDAPRARFGIIASGKAYEDVLQALIELGIGAAERAAIGLRIYKVRMPWPLEPEGVRRFSEGLEEVLVVEERREIIEHQIKQQLFNWRADVRPRIVGKFDEADRPFLPLSQSLTVSLVAGAIAARLERVAFDDGLKRRIAAHLAVLEAAERRTADHAAAITRIPYFCSGCPHNTSTKVPEGSRALVGIGCHFMVQWMDRRSETFTHMGGEGVNWTGMAPFTDEDHIFVNLGDGTYYHSGLLAIRAAVASGANLTYKLLYNDAVAMTGGQPVDGPLTPHLVAEQLHAEGVRPLYLVSDHPEDYPVAQLPPGTRVRHRDELDAVMRDIRQVPGCSAILYVQTCAAEKRRRRSRRLLADPPRRVVINAEVCEGCGDCSVQSNCISVEPLETEKGRKRHINQSSCNKDFSCVKGFCPSFVTVEGGALRKQAATAPDVTGLPEPDLPDVHERPWNIAITGVGGTGVLTIGAVLGMAAFLDGKAPLILDMAGLAQKGGAVLSHIRIGARREDVTSPRIVTGGADLIIAADDIVATSREAIGLIGAARTVGVINRHLTPVADFTRHRDLDFRREDTADALAQALGAGRHVLDFTGLAERLTGDAIATNIMMLGFAWQTGHVPVSRAALERAIELNGVAVAMNRRAFDWGRIAAVHPDRIAALMAGTTDRRARDDMSLAELRDHWARHLTAYQSAALAARHGALVARVDAAAQAAGLGEGLARQCADLYGKLLAYKDEYEVARLLTASAFASELAETFTGDVRLSYHLAPPFLAGRDAQGRPLKRRFGPWLWPLLAVLRHGKVLRGTPVDPFGYTDERRMERRLIGEIETDIARILTTLSRATEPAARRLLDIYGEIRGYGPVKQAAYEAAMARLPAARAALHRSPTAIAAE